ncbi:MAG TPA: tRNA (adenosine(37)-N6)-dimethylallyltransferase MiaA [Anaerolineaceae bacterium]|nr:tRNA (adenosine(37)-N6)-dimethylallyltransferase MiaA [Anaerolineaceae bacterium]
MPSINYPNPLIVLVGPTAVGKTELAIQLAKQLNGEIVSADSRLFYRGMDIGTAKPSLADRQIVPHHLVDVAEPDDVWSLVVFQNAARQAILDIQSRRKLPFLVGGTGQYIRSVIEGWQAPPQQPDYRMRVALEKWAGEIGSLELHRRLSLVDPVAAASIDYSNLRRTVRALEVIFCTGRRFSEQRRKSISPYSLLLIGLIRSRTDLHTRIDQRIDMMLEMGFADEVRNLLDKGYSPQLPTLSAIGYREMISYIKGEMTLEEAVIQMKRMTRQFVRRQANWFKINDPHIHWFDANENTNAEIEAFIQSGQGWIMPENLIGI